MTQPSTNKDPISLLIERNPCSLCRKSRRAKCTCGPGGGGGSGGSSDEKTNTAKVTESTSSTKMNPAQLSEQNDVKSTLNVSNAPNKQELLSIKNDSEPGILTILANYILAKNPQEALQAIFGEFEAFKLKLKEKGEVVDNFTAERTNNSLTMRIPNPKFYDDFIQQLILKNLIPSQSNSQTNTDKNKASENKRSAFNPTPLSMRPKPKGLTE